jgi:two-component system phosphate regulon response regulator OmpR
MPDPPQTVLWQSSIFSGVSCLKENGHLLVIDDDDRIRDLLKEFLIRDGFRVSTAVDAVAADRLLTQIRFDLIVLDVMLPGEDGLSFLRRLRAMPSPLCQTPVLLLTARGEGEDRIRGLSLGADDYLPKPFDPRELALRIEAILRRSGVQVELEGPVRMGDTEIDLERAMIEREGESIRLTEAEVDLLRELLAAGGQPVDRYRLMRDDADETGRAVDVQVTRLRRKLEPDPRNPRYLQTVRGTGYRLLVD